MGDYILKPLGGTTGDAVLTVRRSSSTDSTLSSSTPTLFMEDWEQEFS